MIDQTEKPKIPSKFAKYAARYKEFRSNFHTPPIHTSAKIPLATPSFKAPLY